MRPPRSRKSADPSRKWKPHAGTLLPSTLACLFVFGQAEVGSLGAGCLSNPCVYGICLDDVNGTFSCYCVDGYTGFLCQTNWDECWSNPCLNGGACVDGIAQFNCTCPQGYQGELCEQNIDECDSNPCHNNGTCIDGPNGYACVCPSGYLGSFCETDVSVCNDTRETKCLNGGLCTEGPGFTFDCACPLGWSGEFCEEPVDECASSPCCNGGVCLDLHANYTCACPFGYSGRNCEVELEMCGDASPCQNGALCLVEDWLRVCYCVPDFHGDRCQFQYNECLLGPGCRNGGTCVDGVDGFDCSCPPGWSGSFCECLITDEGEIDCNYVEPPPVASSTPPPTPVQTVPISNETEVPKTTPYKDPSSTTPRHSYSVLTECIPVRPQITTKLPETTPEMTVPTQATTHSEEWLTQNVLPPQGTHTEAESTTVQTTTTTEATTTTTAPTTTTKTTTQTTTKQTVPTTTQTTTTETTPETTTPTTTTTTTTQATSTTTTTTTTETTPATTATVPETTTTLTTPTTSTTSTTTAATTTAVPSTTTTLSTTTSITYVTQVRPTTEMPWNCTVRPCRNGGTCHDTPNGPRCACKWIWEGPYCENKLDVKLAGFSGESYLSHRLSNTHSIKIDVTARTIAPVGVILYSHLGANTFMTLYLEDGLLKFKFSCGVQTMLLSEVQFRINNGFDLVASVTLEFFPPTSSPTHCGATVRVNNSLAMSGEQLAKGPHADSGYAWVYVGGVPRRYVDKEEVPLPKGFVGCMKNLAIDREPRGIFRDSFESDGIVECKSLACLSSPCRSGSTCVENNNTWACLCRSGFLGRLCEMSVCDNNPCKFGGTCVPFPGSGFLCLCPAGKQGLFCENDVETGYPLFASSVSGFSTFAAYKLPTEIHQDMLLTFKFVPHEMEQISLMVFIGQDGYHGTTSDHLSVSFIKGYVVLTWNLGSGPRRIFTKHPVANEGRSFHTVQIGRTGPRAWLAVDKQQNVTGKSPGKLTQLNTRSVVYLGGHDSRNFSLLPHDLPLHTGFSGCLFDVELRTGQMLIKIEKTSPTFSRGVGQCGRTLCNEGSCENGGGCIHHGATFTCLCSEGWFGPTCSLKYNPCDSTRHNCSEGSTCVPLRRGFSCDCPVGKTGKYCERSEELSDVMLKGERSYVALFIEGLHHMQSCIDLEIRPLGYHGLILYSGKLGGNNFWSLSLQDGVLELRVSPGVFRKRGDALTIKCRRVLTVGKWHRIRAGRYGRRLFLWVDGTVNTGVLLPGENIPPSGSVVYIGGVPDLSKIPAGVSGRILTSFHGCVRKFMSQWKRIPLNKANILEGRNVEDCDGGVCGGDVCENGGTCHIGANNEAFCTCPKQYLGKRCEHRLSCKETNCQNGGRCAQEQTSTPQCHCPNGWGGPFCESGVDVRAPQFGGNSYLLIDRGDSVNVKRDTRSRVDVNFIRLNFTTAEPSGMLLWSSKRTGQEFIGIGIERRRIKIVWAWNEYNETVVSPREEIADGGWHDLAISFDSPNVTVSMDRKTIYESSLGYPGYPLATDGRFFLGGFPEGNSVVNQTLGHFSSGFDGCLQKLSWGAESAISNFSKFAGENIRTCDPFGL